MRKLLKKGFTIVELVIVIAVIAILAAVLIPTFAGVVDKANSSAALQTARNTLSNALNMSSTGSLSGQKASGEYTTMFVTNGYAFGYTGNELKAIDYPKSTSTTFLNTPTSKRNSFNAILIAAEDIEYTVGDATKTAADGNPSATTDCTIKNVNKVIAAWSDDNKLGCLSVEATVKFVCDADGSNAHYYVNYVAKSGETPASHFAEIYVNSDFAKNIVIFTTFGA